LIVNLIALLLLAAGAAGWIATLRMQLPHLSFYTYGSEVLIYTLLILTGVGLVFRLRAARILALGWLKTGALAIVAMPVTLVVWQLLKFGPLEMVRTVFFLRDLYLQIFLGILGLAAFSYLCRRLFLYLRSEAVAARFGSAIGAPSSSVIYACVMVYVGLAFYAQQRQMLDQSRLPRSLQTREYIDQVRKWRENALLSLVGGPTFTDGGRMFVVALGQPQLFPNEALCLVDIATGKMTRFELYYADLRSASTQNYSLERMLSPDLPLLWLRGNEILDLRTSQRLKMQVPDEGRLLAPLGFLSGSKRFLLYDAEHFRMQAVDVTSGALAWSLDVSPPGGVYREDSKREFHGTVLGGTLSPDRARFAYLYLDDLHVVDTETGKRESYPAERHESAPKFSRESDWVITRSSNGDKPGALYDLKTKKRVPHGLKGEVLYFSSTSRRIIGIEHRIDYKSTTTVLTRVDLADPSKPRWSFEDSARHTHSVTDDGKRLYALGPGPNQFEYLDLDAVTSDAPPAYAPFPVELPVAERRYIVYSPDHRMIVVPHSPKMTLIQADASAGAKPTVLDFSAFAPQPKD
jgi:hypothetical protein